VGDIGPDGAVNDSASRAAKVVLGSSDGRCGACPRSHVHSGGAGGVPFTLATGRRADLISMQVFGCPAYVQVDKSQRRKRDDRKGVFAGYASESPS
jgi:hypothetical protein